MMKHQQVEKRKEGLYGIIGTLGFDCVVLVEKEGLQAITESPEAVVFDFSQVQCCSSATLALLLSWFRYAKRLGKPLSFESLPKKVLMMLESAGLKQALLTK